MKTVKEVSRITGVNVRTLHHYDAIENSLERLHTVLLFRELQFPLKEIQAILDSPGFDPM